MKRSETVRFLGMLAASAAMIVVVIATLNGRVNRLRMQRFEDVSMLMLGTSLFRYAIPDSSGGPVLSDIADGNFLRLGYSSASEGQLLQLARLGARAGVRKIAIEVNPIVSRFAGRDECSASNRWKEVYNEIRRSARPYLRGRDILGGGLGDPPQDVTTANMAADLDRLYPLQVEGPCLGTAWVDLVASHPSTAFMFVAMPRRRAARDRIGADGMAQFNSAAIDFAQGVGSDLFLVDPDGSWGDENFVDQAHQSAIGAERFQRTFSIWHGALP
ncbi:hypothetical protein [Sulfitobacter pontiacus]|uniref:hypothetical protein n=1 Tax=Sulfitobacter pontiacus TaxID=60137 RepID=UPI0015DE19AD|nr:hypothetical protein [Sulfitobacter pontiacus]QLL44303.1 hypothetical protein G6548_17050 [Sulfitobacter pontiacus]